MTSKQALDATLAHCCVQHCRVDAKRLHWNPVSRGTYTSNSKTLRWIVVVGLVVLFEVLQAAYTQMRMSSTIDSLCESSNPVNLKIVRRCEWFWTLHQQQDLPKIAHHKVGKSTGCWGCAWSLLYLCSSLLVVVVVSSSQFYWIQNLIGQILDLKTCPAPFEFSEMVKTSRTFSCVASTTEKFLQPVGKLTIQVHTCQMQQFTPTTTAVFTYAVSTY